MTIPLTPQQILLSVGIPTAVAILLLLIRRRWIAPLAVCAAFLVGFPIILSTWKIFPPTESTHWLIEAAVAMAALGAIDAAIHLPSWVRIATVFVLAILSAIAVMQFKISGLDFLHVVIFVAGIGVVALIWWIALDLIERDPLSISAGAWCMLIASAGVAAILPVQNGLRQGRLCGALACSASAGLLLTLLFRRKIFQRGAAPIFAIIPVLLIVSGAYLFDLSNLYLSLLLSIPLPILAGRFIPVARFRPVIRTFIRVAPVALFVTIVLAMAAIAFRKAMLEDEEGDSFGLRQTSGSTSIIQRAI